MFEVHEFRRFTFDAAVSKHPCDTDWWITTGVLA